MAEVNIFGDAQYACLSNFATGFGFWIEGNARSRRKWWPSAEHYFQAGKFADAELQERIRRAQEPEEAKGLGRSLQPLRPDWEEIKRARLREAMLLKLRAHQRPRELLLSIPDGARIVNANPVDPFFGTGRDGNGANVIGLELQDLRRLLLAFPERRSIKLIVADVGEACEPFWLSVDLTGVEPVAVTSLAAAALCVPPESIVGLEFATDGGFETTDVADFADARSLDDFLGKNVDDCELKVRFDDCAIVTLWDGDRDQFLARTDLRHLCPSLPALQERLRDLVPSMAYEGFSASLSMVVDDDEENRRTFDAASFATAVADAAEYKDVVISVSISSPSGPPRPLLAPPDVDLGAATVPAGIVDAAFLIDRIRGLIWGAALGDAVGLATEFMKKPQASENYPDPNKLSPASRVEDKHRSRWVQGDWTDDTDQFALLLDAVVAGGGILDQRSFARSLKAWREKGFPELGDKSGLGIGETVNGVLEHPLYDMAPDLAADVVWRQSGCTMAANGAVMRASASAIGFFWDEEVVLYNAAAAARVTHADPRCIASCVAVAYLLSRMLQGVTINDLEHRIGELASAANTATHHLDGGDSDELWKHMNVRADGLQGLELGVGGIGYTYKSLGAACWAFAHAETFKDGICKITMEAGDADSNATVAGALLGARLGYAQLPQDWLQEVPELQRRWLEDKIVACLRMLGL